VKPINPPAIVREHIDIADLDRHIRNLVGDILHEDKINLQRVVEAGKSLVKRRGLCKVGEWMPFIEKLDISTQRASEWMRIAGLTEEQIEGCDSIRAALKLLKEEAGTDTLAPPAIEDEESPASPSPGITDTPGVERDLRCERCKRVGRWNPECEECKANKRRIEGEPAKRSPSPSGSTRRDMFETPPQENGQLLFDFGDGFRKPLEAAVRAVDNLARPFSAVNTPEAEGLRRKLREVMSEAEVLWKNLVKASKKR